MKFGLPLLPTTLVGSYAQPDRLIDREKLGKRFPPRVRARELWRVAPEWLEQAQDDATILAIRDQELAGLDIIRLDRDLTDLLERGGEAIRVALAAHLAIGARRAG